jgi:large subunit ribosomal protein L15
MPLYRRVPKRGFRNIFAKEFVILSIADLNRYRSGSTVSPESLVKDGAVRKLRDGLRILGQGELKKKLTVKAHHFTKSARRKIEGAGGSCEVIV